MVFKFSEVTWELLEDHLSVPRHFVTAVSVPEDFLNCQ